MSAPSRDDVAALMPQLKDELARLVAIPSISALGYPEHTRPALLETHDAIVELLRELGVAARHARAPGHRAGHPRRDPGAGRGARPSSSTATTTSCRSATRRSGSRRRSRRPSATARSTDAAPPTRSRTSSCTSARCAPGTGEPPVGIKIVIEGQEETGSAFYHLPADSARAVRGGRDGHRGHGEHPPGVPTLTIGLRGMGVVTDRGADARRPEALGPVRRRGSRCAARRAPRARVACTTSSGDVAVDGLRREEWTGASFSDEEFRELAEIEDGHAVRRHRRARRAPLVGPRAHRHRHRRRCRSTGP